MPEHDYSTKTRLLRLLIAIMERPKIYTKRKLAEIYGVSTDTIKHDFEAIRNAGFLLLYDERHRYYLQENQPLKQLKDLLHFTEEDQQLLYDAIDRIASHDKRGKALKKKLSALYDWHLLGHSYLRKPYLTRLDLLLQAQKEKRQVVLKNYHSSNSNEIRDRRVEPFHPAPPEDTVQAFDVEQRQIRHFRISRIERVQLTDTPWQFEGHHHVQATDPFRIVNNDQVMVHLRINISGYNELLERYPLTKSHILPTEDPNIYDFQCRVNAEFKGLTNFILGHYHGVEEIIAPQSLIDHLKNQRDRMKF